MVATDPLHGYLVQLSLRISCLNRITGPRRQLRAFITSVERLGVTPLGDAIRERRQKKLAFGEEFNRLEAIQIRLANLIENKSTFDNVSEEDAERILDWQARVTRESIEAMC